MFGSGNGTTQQQATQAAVPTDQTEYNYQSAPGSGPPTATTMPYPVVYQGQVPVGGTMYGYVPGAGGQPASTYGPPQAMQTTFYAPQHHQQPIGPSASFTRLYPMNEYGQQQQYYAMQPQQVTGQPLIYGQMPMSHSMMPAFAITPQQYYAQQQQTMGMPESMQHLQPQSHHYSNNQFNKQQTGSPLHSSTPMGGSEWGGDGGEERDKEREKDASEIRSTAGSVKTGGKGVTTGGLQNGGQNNHAPPSMISCIYASDDDLFGQGQPQQNQENMQHPMRAQFQQLHLSTAGQMTVPPPGFITPNTHYFTSPSPFSTNYQMPNEGYRHSLPGPGLNMSGNSGVGLEGTFVSVGEADQHTLNLSEPPSFVVPPANQQNERGGRGGWGGQRGRQQQQAPGQGVEVIEGKMRNLRFDGNRPPFGQAFGGMQRQRGEWNGGGGGMRGAGNYERFKQQPGGGSGFFGQRPFGRPFIPREERDRTVTKQHPCYIYRDTGECNWGDECIYSHEIAEQMRQEGLANGQQPLGTRMGMPSKQMGGHHHQGMGLQMGVQALLHRNFNQQQLHQARDAQHMLSANANPFAPNQANGIPNANQLGVSKIDKSGDSGVVSEENANADASKAGRGDGDRAQKQQGEVQTHRGERPDRAESRDGRERGDARGTSRNEAGQLKRVKPQMGMGQKQGGGGGGDRNQPPRDGGEMYKEQRPGGHENLGQKFRQNRGVPFTSPGSSIGDRERGNLGGGVSRPSGPSSSYNHRSARPPPPNRQGQGPPPPPHANFGYGQPPSGSTSNRPINSHN